MNTKVQSKRPERKSLFQRGPQSISGEKDPNFFYRFVNDTGSRIHNFKQAGYEIVTEDTLSVGDARVSDAGSVGNGKAVISNDGTVSYLMRIKKEWYEEDQLQKARHIDEQESAMKADASKGMYGGIKTTRD